MKWEFLSQVRAQSKFIINFASTNTVLENFQTWFSLWLHFSRNGMLNRSSQMLVGIGTCSAAHIILLRPGSNSSTLANFQNAHEKELCLRITTSPTLNFAISSWGVEPLATYLPKLVRYSFRHQWVNCPSKWWWCFSLFVKELYELMVS